MKYYKAEIDKVQNSIILYACNFWANWVQAKLQFVSPALATINGSKDQIRLAWNVPPLSASLAVWMNTQQMICPPCCQE